MLIRVPILAVTLFACASCATPLRSVANQLEDPDRGVRYAAAQALGRAGSAAGIYAVEVAARLDDPEWCVRASAIHALGRIGPAGLPHLVDAWESHPVEERVMIVRAVAWVGPEGRTFLLAHENDPEKRIRDAVEAALEAPERPGAAPAPLRDASRTTPPDDPPELLVDRLSDPDLAVSLAASEQLPAWGERAARPVAQAMTSGRYDVLHYADRIFRELGPRGSPAVPLLIPLLEHEDENVREVVARILGEIGPPAADAVPALIAVLGDERIGVGARAMVALGRIGRAGEEDLLDALSSPEPRVRAGAVFALGWMHAEVEPAVYEPRLPMAPPAGDPSSLDVERLSAPEAERTVERMLPEIFRDGSKVGFGHIYDFFGSEEVAAGLEYFVVSGRPAEDLSPFAGMCHRIVRPDLIPVLCRMWESPDAWALADSSGLWMPMTWSMQYPEYRVQGVLPRRERWLDEALRPEQIEKLIEVAKGPGDELNRIAALVALGKADDPASEAVLRELVEDYDQALASLAQRGDADAVRTLRERAAEDDDCLGLLLMARPADGREVLLVRVLDENRPCPEIIDTIQHLKHEGIRWRASDFTGVEEAVLAAEPSTVRLAEIALGVPTLRTRGVAAGLFDRLEPAGPRALLEASLDHGEELKLQGWLTWRDLFAFLDAADRDRLRSMLRGWLRTEEGRDLEYAVLLIARLGDPASGPSLLRWVKEHPERARAGHKPLVGLLGRSSTPEILTWLRETARTDPAPETRGDALRALAEAGGLPPDISYLLAGSKSERVTEMILAGRPVDALLASLEEEIVGLADELGSVRDPRIRVWLEGLRDSHPGVGIPEVTGQLALAGDERARIELWSAIRAGRYRWICYENAYPALTLGWSPESLPFLISDLEGNCCRGGHVARMFEDLTGVDHLSFDPHGVDGSPARNLRQYLELYPGRWFQTPFGFDGWTIRVAAEQDRPGASPR